LIHNSATTPHFADRLKESGGVRPALHEKPADPQKQRMDGPAPIEAMSAAILIQEEYVEWRGFF
jgi:hypothetical protein